MTFKIEKNSRKSRIIKIWIRRILLRLTVMRLHHIPSQPSQLSFIVCEKNLSRHTKGKKNPSFIFHCNENEWNEILLKSHKILFFFVPQLLCGNTTNEGMTFWKGNWREKSIMSVNRLHDIICTASWCENSPHCLTKDFQCA